MRKIMWIVICLALGIVAFVGAPATACNPRWSVQGVIDWGSFGYGPDAVVQRMHEEKWDVTAPGGESLSPHAARDSFVFLPQDVDFDADVPFRTLAGSAALLSDRLSGANGIDWYQIWIWVDVNGDGIADSRDKIWNDANNNNRVDFGELVDQDWQILVHQDGSPGPYEASNGVADIANLSKPTSDNSAPIKIHAGAYYLLLLEVYAHIPAGGGIPDEGSSLQFSGSVTRYHEQIVLEHTPKLNQTGWDASDPNRKYFRKDGTPLAANGSVDSRVTGVDGFEILWIRVNNPPREPRH